MAEMLIDGAKLDACLDAEADAIRAKTGDSNDLTFDFANNKGFADAIAAIPSGGGGNTLESDFLTIYKETVEIGENTVTNSAGYRDYLVSIKSIPGTLFAMSIHKKASYTYNEWANGYANGNNSIGYRYRNTWQTASWNFTNYDAVAPVGTLVDVYTVELKNPNNA